MDEAIMRTIHLQEQVTRELERHELDEADGLTIHRSYGKMIDVTFPSPITESTWRLRPGGWVGSIPLHPELRIVIEPKVPVASIFRMLEYAYGLKSFHILDGVSPSDQLDEVYQRLAQILARRVLARSRRGFHRSYVTEEDQLSFVRGSIDIPRSLRAPWNVELHCAFQEHTADIVDNQILAWTLYTIARQRVCRGESLEYVRKAWRSLHGVATTQPFRPADCLRRLYNRLNDDYRPLHALCRFFLEQAGPTHRVGQHTMVPFIVDMARLYEEYVVAYLRTRLSDRYRLSAQQNFKLTEEGTIGITIDMIISDAITGETIAVLDTKYKRKPSPSSDDIQQIVAYAAHRQCRHGILIYPIRMSQGIDKTYGSSDIHITTTMVSAEGEIGEELAELLQ